jgi:hypothetical protein
MLCYSIENMDINKKKQNKWNNLFLTKTEILYYYYNNNIYVSNGISVLFLCLKIHCCLLKNESDFIGIAVIFESCQKKIGTTTLPCM